MSTTVAPKSVDVALLRELSLRPAYPANAFGRDPSNPYYDFLYHVVAELGADRVLELGTCTGGSASHMAAARRECRVFTVDILQHPVTREKLRTYSPNVELVQGDSCDSEVVTRLEAHGPYDLIFFDTDHRYDLIKKEWELYRGMIRSGGVALFDDIFMNEGMKRFWEEVPDPKVAFKHLHWTGFGVHIVGGG